MREYHMRGQDPRKLAQSTAPTTKPSPPHARMRDRIYVRLRAENLVPSATCLSRRLLHGVLELKLPLGIPHAFRTGNAGMNHVGIPEERKNYQLDPLLQEPVILKVLESYRVLRKKTRFVLNSIQTYGVCMVVVWFV